MLSVWVPLVHMIKRFCGVMRIYKAAKLYRATSVCGHSSPLETIPLRYSTVLIY